MMLSLISVSLVLVMVTSAKSKPNIMFLLTDDQVSDQCVVKPTPPTY